MKKLICLFLALGLSISSIAQTGTDKKMSKKEKAAQEFSKTKALVETSNFDFEAEWANPMRGARINLISTPNFFRLRDQHLHVEMPYYGQAQLVSSSMFKGDGGIIYKGDIVDLKSKINEKKQKIILRFKTKESEEAYNFILTIFKNGNSSLNISSSMRDNIGYDGKISKPKSDKD